MTERENMALALKAYLAGAVQSANTENWLDAQEHLLCASHILHGFIIDDHGDPWISDEEGDDEIRTVQDRRIAARIRGLEAQIKALEEEIGDQ